METRRHGGAPGEMAEDDRTHDPLIDALEALGEDREQPGDALMLQGLRRELGLTDAPLRIGRFVLREPLGAGGMGVVYAADDPHLERRVAIKVLAPIHDEDPLRGLAEARALARLSHPNVVAVHEAGLHEGRVYLVMELVEGQTLRQWLGERRHWREVCAVMLAAGRGLAAAHAVGVVHCDIKPDNVLVGDRVRVADFGLARATVRTSEAAVGEGEGEGEGETEDGRGTLAFMAPEQLAGEAADTRSDQFSLCATFYLALTGEAPFPGVTARERRDAIARGVPRGRLASVPRWLRAMIVRGLQLAPERRHPRLDDMLDELQRRLRPRRWAGLGLATAVVAAAVAMGWWISATGASQCRPLARRIDEVWNRPRRDAIATAFEATELPYSAHALSVVESSADRYAVAWSDARVDACRARQQGRRVSAVVQCLEDRRTELDALLDGFALADARIVKRAAESISSLGSPYACARARETDEAAATLDEASQARLDAAREAVAQAWALEQMGRYVEGRDVLAPAVQSLRTLPAPTTLATALLGLGRIEIQTGALDDAHTHLEEALHVGLGARADDVAARAALALCDELTQRGEFVRAHEAAALAQTLHRRVHGDIGWPWVEAKVGALLLREVRDEEVVARMTESIAAARADERGNATALLSMYQAQSNALSRLGRLPEAEAALVHARAIARQLLGEAHPMYAVLLISVATVLHGRGDTEGALREQRRALEIWQRGVPEPSPVTASMIHNVGFYTLALGRPRAALDSMRDALARWQEVLPPGHARLAAAHTGIGRALRALGEYDEALEHHERALEILRAPIEAREPEAGYSLLQAAITALDAGRSERADLWIAQGLAVYADAPNPVMEASFRFARARSLAYAGDRSAAIGLARGALDDLRGADETAVREIEAWLSSMDGAGDGAADGVADGAPADGAAAPP